MMNTYEHSYKLVEIQIFSWKMNNYEFHECLIYMLAKTANNKHISVIMNIHEHL